MFQRLPKYSKWFEFVSGEQKWNTNYISKYYLIKINPFISLIDCILPQELFNTF